MKQNFYEKILDAMGIVSSAPSKSAGGRNINTVNKRVKQSHVSSPGCTPKSPTPSGLER